jgi:protocatechuate 3,4-dioxygenase beta subunit
MGGWRGGVLVAGLVALVALIVLLANREGGPRAGSRTGAAGSRPERRDADPEAPEGTAPPAVATLVVRVLAGVAPVAGAEVAAHGPEGLEAWSRVAPARPEPAVVRRTGDDGIARIPIRRTGDWEVVARHEGYAPAVASVYVVAGREPLTLHLQPGCEIQGRVVDERGAPVPGVAVTAGASLFWGIRRHLGARTTTGEDGAFVLEGLPAGDVQIAPGDPPTHPITVRCPLRGRLDLVLRRRGALAGRVTDADTGAPLPGVRVRAEAAGAIGFAVTGDDGEFRCANLPPGQVHRLAAAKDGFVPVHPQGVVAPPGESPYLDPVGARGRVKLAIPIRAGETTRYDFALRRGAKLVGTVRGPDGPLAGATVHVVTDKAQNGYLVAPATTDADGRYEFPGVMEGPLLAYAAKEGYFDPARPGAWWRKLLRESPIVAPREGVVTHDIEMQRGADVVGRVEDERGAPLAGATVIAVQKQPLGLVFRAHSDETGAFRLAGLAPGHELEVRCGRDGFGCDEAVRTPVPAEGFVVRMVAMPVVRGVVRDERGAPVPAARVELLQDAFQPLAGQVGLDSVAAGPDGGYRIHVRSATKTFEVRARAPGFADTTSPPQEPGRPEYEVDLTLARGATLEGRVTSAGGEPIAGAQIRVGAPGVGNYPWHLPVRTVSADDGAFCVDGIVGTRTRLVVSAVGFRPSDSVVDVGAPATVVLESSLRITGRVQYRDGTPGAGLTIVAVPAGKKRWDMFWFAQGSGLRADGMPGRVECVTRDDGGFELTDVAKGKHWLQFVPGSADRAVRPQREHVVEAGDEGVVVVVEAVDDPGPFATLSLEELGRGARYLTMVGKPEKAIEMWRALLARGPDQPARIDATLELARALRDAKRHDEAEALVRELLPAAPATTAKGLMLRVALARSILAQGRPEEARTLAREVEAAKGTDARAALYGAWIAATSDAELGHRAEAIHRLERIAKEAEPIDPSLAILVRNTLKSLRSSGD